MRVEEAIENLTFLSREGTQDMEFADYEAVKLGIEALKERQEAIEQGLPLWHELLPGETKK